MGSTSNERRNRRGATLVLVALSFAALAGLGALAVDLGMLYKARNDAQRAAEAGALAGASAFIDLKATDPQVVDVAKDRAWRFSKANTILNEPVTLALEADSGVQVIQGSQKVRVVVGTQVRGNWFARLARLRGADSVLVRASAAAVAAPAGGADCVRPFAVPDTWSENTPGQDTNGDKVEDNLENWSYTRGEDTYSPGNPDQPSAGDTGYGSDLRNTSGLDNDLGREISLRLPDPASPTPPTGPRQFRPFSTSTGGNPNDPGDYLQHIKGCDPAAVQLGKQYTLVTGGPQIEAATQQGIDELYDADPGAKWDADSQSVTNSAYGNWRNSPRVVKVGFFDPTGQLGVPGQTAVTLNNIGLIFIETKFDGVNKAINGRFLYFATGAGDPDGSAPPGTLVKRLRLVE